MKLVSISMAISFWFVLWNTLTLNIAEAASAKELEASVMVKAVLRKEPSSNAPKVEQLDSGDVVDLVLVKSKPVEKSISVGSGKNKKTTLFFQVKNRESGRTGWVVRESLSKTRPRYFESPRLPIAREKAVTAECREDLAAKLEKTRRDASQLVKAASQIPSPVKSEKELDRFTCFHRDSSVSFAEFRELLPRIKSSALAAEKAFGVPAPLVRCAMLAESGLVRNAKSKIDAIGLAQVREGTVDMLAGISKRPGFAEALKAYNERVKGNAVIDNRNVRTQSNVVSAVAAMAVYFKYMREEFIEKSCTDCTRADGGLNRKEAYLLITGYNAGHTVIPKVAQRSTADFFTNGDPETIKYIHKMDRCLSVGHEKTFVESEADIAATNRKRREEIAELVLNRQKRAQKKGVPVNEDVEAKSLAQQKYVESMIAIRAPLTYEHRLRECAGF